MNWLQVLRGSLAGQASWAVETPSGASEEYWASKEAACADCIWSLVYCAAACAASEEALARAASASATAAGSPAADAAAASWRR